MDIEDDLGIGLGLTTPGKNFVDIEDTESDSNEDADDVMDEKPENKSSEKLNLSDVLDNICKKFSANPVPSTWPFLVGNLVCFRSTKTSEWFDGKIEKKIPGVDGEDIQLLISLVNNPAVIHEIPYRTDLVKSNKHTAETLNNLDLQLQPRKHSRTFAFKDFEKDKSRSNKNGKSYQKERTSEKVKASGNREDQTLMVKNGQKEKPNLQAAVTTVEEDPQILNEKSSESLACVEVSETQITEEDSSGPSTLSEGKTLEERICEMFEENSEEFTGIDFKNLKNLEDLMRSLAQNQVKTLVLSASSDLVKVVSTRSGYQVGQHF